MTMSATRAREVLNLVCDACTSLLQFIDSRSPLTDSERKALGSRLTDALGDPMRIFAYRLRQLERKSVEALALVDKRPGEESQLVAPLNWKMIDLDNGILILLGDPKPEHDPLLLVWRNACRGCEEAYDEVMRSVEPSQLERRSEPVEDTPVDAAQRMQWESESPIWTGAAQQALRTTQLLLRTVSRSRTKPEISVVEACLREFEALREEFADGDAVTEFRHVLEEQGDTRAAMIVYLRDLVSELECTITVFESDDPDAILSVLCEADDSDGTPLVGELEKVALIDSLVGLFLPSKGTHLEQHRELLDELAMVLALLPKNANRGDELST